MLNAWGKKDEFYYLDIQIALFFSIVQMNARKKDTIHTYFLQTSRKEMRFKLVYLEKNSIQ